MHLWDHAWYAFFKQTYKNLQIETVSILRRVECSLLNNGINWTWRPIFETSQELVAMNSLERGDMLCKRVHLNDSFTMLVPLIVITQYKSGTGIVHTTSETLCLTNRVSWNFWKAWCIADLIILIIIIIIVQAAYIHCFWLTTKWESLSVHNESALWMPIAVSM